MNSKRFRVTDPGMWNNIQSRARQWLYLINFLMIASLYFREYQFRWWHILVAVGYISLIIIDQWKVFPREIDYSWKIPGTIPNDIYLAVKNIEKKVDPKKES